MEVSNSNLSKDIVNGALIILFNIRLVPVGPHIVSPLKNLNLFKIMETNKMI